MVQSHEVLKSAIAELNKLTTIDFALAVQKWNKIHLAYARLEELRKLRENK